jgi:hypothetical protein
MEENPTVKVIFPHELILCGHADMTVQTMIELKPEEVVCVIRCNQFGYAPVSFYDERLDDKDYALMDKLSGKYKEIDPEPNGLGWGFVMILYEDSLTKKLDITMGFVVHED